MVLMLTLRTYTKGNLMYTVQWLLVIVKAIVISYGRSQLFT